MPLCGRARRIHRGKRFFRNVKLASVDLPRPPSSVLTVRIHQVPGFVDDRGLGEQDLRGPHPDSILLVLPDGFDQPFDPVRLGDRVIVEKGDELSGGFTDCEIVRPAKSLVALQTDQAEPGQASSSTTLTLQSLDPLSTTMISRGW
jgi:hypothetical protein